MFSSLNCLSSLERQKVLGLCIVQQGHRIPFNNKNELLFFFFPPALRFLLPWARNLDNHKAQLGNFWCPWAWLNAFDLPEYSKLANHHEAGITVLLLLHQPPHWLAHVSYEKMSYQLWNFDVLKINNSRDFPGAECPAGSEWPLVDKTLHYHSVTLVHVLKKAGQGFFFVIVAPGIVQKCGLISTNGMAALELSP